MTRDALLEQVAKLDEAARVGDWRAQATIGAPATEAEIRDCENALNVTIPVAYRETLREWNGCTIELCEAPKPGEERGRTRTQWFISELESIVVCTEIVREQFADAMAGMAIAAQVADMMARIVVIVYQDGACIYVPSSDSDSTVRAMKLEWALAEYPPTPDVIASSPDEYLEKSFRYLGETLETDLYWW